MRDTSVPDEVVTVGGARRAWILRYKAHDLACIPKFAMIRFDSVEP